MKLILEKVEIVIKSVRFEYFWDRDRKIMKKMCPTINGRDTKLRIQDTQIIAYKKRKYITPLKFWFAFEALMI